MPKVSHGVLRGSRLTSEEKPVQPVVGKEHCIKFVHMQTDINRYPVYGFYFILVHVGDFEQFLEQQLELDKVSI